jgi:hypothetical protein
MTRRQLWPHRVEQLSQLFRTIVPIVQSGCLNCSEQLRQLFDIGLFSVPFSKGFEK